MIDTTYFDSLVRATAQQFGLTPEEIIQTVRGSADASEARSVVIYLYIEHALDRGPLKAPPLSGAVREVAVLMGRSRSAVYAAHQMVKRRLEHDRDLKQQMNIIGCHT